MRTKPPSEPIQLVRFDRRQELEINNRHELSQVPSRWIPAEEADWTVGVIREAAQKRFWTKKGGREV
jgi:hypothetical protein